MAQRILPFKSCGRNVVVEDDVHIPHPENLIVGDHVTFMRGFRMLHTPRLCRIGSNVTFYPGMFIQGSGELIIEDHVDFFPNTYLSLGHKGPSFIRIGHHSHFAPGCVLYGHGGLSVGAYVNVGPHVVLATAGHQHHVTDKPMALSGTLAGPITIDRDVWIGANVTVTANTHVAHGCVIGANALLCKDTKPMGLYTGVPARRTRDRT